MRFGDILQMKQSTLKRFLRLPHFDEHLELHRLDATSAHGDLTLYDFARGAYEAEPAPDLRPAPLLTGRDLIAAGYRSLAAVQAHARARRGRPTRRRRNTRATKLSRW